MATDEQFIKSFYDDYLAAFHSLEPSSVARFYSPPCLFIGDAGSRLMRDSAEVEAFFAGVIDDLERKNYDYSEIRDLRVEMLSSRLALVRGLAVRHAKDATELERLRAVYTLRKELSDWKFVTAVAYPTDD